MSRPRKDVLLSDFRKANRKIGVMIELERASPDAIENAVGSSKVGQLVALRNKIAEAIDVLSGVMALEK